MIQRRILVILLGVLLDLLLGDPKCIYHPVRGIGKLIEGLETLIRKGFPKNRKGEFLGGLLLVLLVCGVSFGIPVVLLQLCDRIWKPAGFLLESFWCFRLLAMRSLRTESRKVYDRLVNGTLEEARYAVSMIVGRDTINLTPQEVAKAAVETVAENSSDGVIAPLFYIALGGVPLMFFYKAVNTMDSMIGYKNESYLFFGRCAARLDDLVNFVPARISGLLMAAAAFPAGLDGKNAFRIFFRDRRKHASPNSAQTEAAMAGALRVQLAGNAYYFGKLVEKPVIGDPLRQIEPEDILRANRLLYWTGGLAVLAGTTALLVFAGR